MILLQLTWVYRRMYMALILSRVGERLGCVRCLKGGCIDVSVLDLWRRNVML